jgi:hypothetical protein
VRNSLLVFASYLAVAALFSWPALEFQGLPLRHFDLYPAAWLVDVAPDAFPRMFYAQTAWPFGESLVRIDSYLLLGIGWLNQGILSGATLVCLLAWLGPALSATAAEGVAFRIFQVPRPYSWIAGTAFACSGIAAVALLEGHVYHLLNPWMPLFLGFLWLGTSEKGRFWHGLLAGIFWALCLYTTAYLGVGATLLGFWVFLRAPWRGLKLLPSFLGTALPPALYYVWLFRLGGAWADNAPLQPGRILDTGGNSLLGMLGPSAEIDLSGHSLVAPPGFLILFLWMLSPRILSGQQGWRWLSAGALLFLLISFGATFRILPGGEGLPSPLRALQLFHELALFRFPLRLLWPFGLLAGIVAARAAAQLGHRPILLLALLDVFLSTGMPFRQQQAVAEIPSVYAKLPADVAVLDIYGEVIGPTSGDWKMRLRGLGCYYQGGHHRRLPELCIGTAISSPRERLSQWFVAQATDSAGLDQQDQQRLTSWGIGAIILHLDSLRPADVRVLQEKLSEALGPPFAETKDGGERLEVFTLSSAQPDVLEQRRSMKTLYGR